MKQVRLARLVEPYYSYAALITHVFNNNEGSLNSHSLDSNLPYAGEDSKICHH